MGMKFYCLRYYRIDRAPKPSLQDQISGSSGTGETALTTSKECVSNSKLLHELTTEYGVLVTGTCEPLSQMYEPGFSSFRNLPVESHEIMKVMTLTEYNTTPSLPSLFTAKP